MKIDIEKVRLVLKGEMGMSDAFYWSEHEFGYRYWDEQQNRLIDGKPLDPIAREELERMIAEHDAKASRMMWDDVEPERAVHVYNADTGEQIKREKPIVKSSDCDLLREVTHFFADDLRFAYVEPEPKDKPKPKSWEGLVNERGYFLASSGIQGINLHSLEESEILALRNYAISLRPLSQYPNEDA